MELVGATLRDGPMVTEIDMLSTMERDMDSLTDGECTMDMDMETHPARDQSWDMESAPMLPSHSSGLSQTTAMVTMSHGKDRI